MTDTPHRWANDPVKWDACGRLEEFGACIGPINDATEHVEIRRRPDGGPVADVDLPAIVDDINTLEDATTLDLCESAITDTGAARLARLATVTAFHLSGVRITDAGVARLAAMPRLRELVLSGIDVTDAGLDVLAGARGLTFLQVFETAVTEEGVSRLAQTLPDLGVER